MKTAFLIALGCIGLTTLLLTGCGGEKRPKVDVQAQIAALKGDDNDARQDALTALAMAGPKAAPAIPALVELLKDKDPLIRRLAVYAIGEIGEGAKSALPAIKELLNDRDRDVSTSAFNAIANIDPKAAAGARPAATMTPQQ